MRVENQPLGSVGEYITAALSPQHPYGKEIIGTRKNIESYSVDAVMTHYKNWYKPNNATLIVVGDVHAEEIFKEAKNLFEKIKAGPLSLRNRQKNFITENIFHEISHYTDKVASEKLCMLFNVPHHSTHEIEDVYALDICLCALFNSAVFKFSRYFIDKKLIVSEFDYCYEQTLDPMPLKLYVSLMPGKSTELFIKKFDQKILSLVKNGLDKKEFDRAKNMCLTNAVYKTKDGHKKIRMVFTDLALGLSVETIEKRQEHIESITISKANSVLKSVFSKKPLGTVKFFPIQ
jgi:zinc protease